MPSNSNNSGSPAPDNITSFVFQELLDHSLSALIQVGSTARGYSSPSSDYDYMAFYGPPALFRSFSVHTTITNHRVTIEHHSLEEFLEKSTDFRFNLASLRQLHKIRDGIHVKDPDPNFEYLRHLANSAHLDRRIPLKVCADIEAVFPMLSTWNPELQQQQLILWTELLSTLDLTSRAGIEAYSKPKWLYRALTRARMTEALATLNELYQPSPQMARQALDQITLMSQDLDTSKLTQSDQRLLQTALDDAQVMAHDHPLQAFPQLRFTADRMLFFQYRARAIDFLRRNEPVPEPQLLLALGVHTQRDPSSFRSSFRSFLTAVNTQLLTDFSVVGDAGPGSDNLSAHLVHSYDASCLEHSSKWQVDQWLNMLIASNAEASRTSA